MPNWVNGDIEIGLRIRGYEVGLPGLYVNGFPFRWRIQDALWLFSHLKNLAIIPFTAELVKISSPPERPTILLLVQDSSFEPVQSNLACPTMRVILNKKGAKLE